MSGGADVQARFAATLVDEWVRCGVTDAVVAPGSRSTPVLVALAVDGRLRVHVVLDERAAGYLALGIGLARGHPAVVVTTSGTAAAELHPSIIEAHQAGVPVLAVTADRPAELHRVGAPQTIEQETLFYGALRWSASPGVAEAAAAATWRSLAARAVVETVANPAGPGPVHLNLAFREPLLGSPSAVPEGRPSGAPWHQAALGTTAPPDDVVAYLASMAGRRGLIVAGAGTAAGVGGERLGVGSGTEPEFEARQMGAGPVQQLATALGWPVLADPPSGARVPGPLTIAAADALLRVPEVAPWRPDVVLRLGQPWASRVVSTWLGQLGPEVDQILVDPWGRWWDPERRAGRVLRCDVTALCQRVSARVATGAAAAHGTAAAYGTEWAAQWGCVEAVAQAAIDGVLQAHPEPTEPGVARALAAAVPLDTRLFVSSSMPVRDVEWYSRPRHGLQVLANRGANGIDGIVATALGLATAGPVTTLLGDLAFLYDAGALLWATRRQVDCALVVVDNDGGGIFSFLPQAGGVAHGQFERYWGTPHGLDLARVAGAYGVPVTELTSLREIDSALAASGVRLVRVRTERQSNVAVHREIDEAVQGAVRRALAG